MSEKIERLVKERFEEWKEIYEIPKELEFDYKSLIQLEIEYEEMSKRNPEHVKTRSELLEMRNKLKRNIPFNLRKNINGFGFAIYAKKIEFIENRLHEIININDIVRKEKASSFIHIKLRNGMDIYATSKIDYLRGRRFLEYWNLSCDENIEKQLSDMRYSNSKK